LQVQLVQRQTLVASMEAWTASVMVILLIAQQRAHPI